MSEPLWNGPVRQGNGGYIESRESDLHCPCCGKLGQLATPDYGFGYGAEFSCHCHCGKRHAWAAHSDKAKAESEASLGLSRANAARYKAEQSK